MSSHKRSRYALIFGALFGLSSTHIPAAVVNYDPFDYTGTSLNTQNGGTGWNGAWFNTATTSATLSNDGVSLSYPATFESPNSTPASAGSRILTGGIGASSSRLLATPVSLAVDGNVLYASALIKKNAANGGAVTTDNILLEFVDSGANRRFGLGIEGAGDKPWLNANGSTTPSAGHHSAASNVSCDRWRRRGYRSRAHVASSISDGTPSRARSWCRCMSAAADDAGTSVKPPV